MKTINRRNLIKFIVAAVPIGIFTNACVLPKNDDENYLDFDAQPMSGCLDCVTGSFSGSYNNSGSFVTSSMSGSDDAGMYQSGSFNSGSIFNDAGVTISGSINMSGSMTTGSFCF